VACILDNIRTIVSHGVSVPDQLAVQEANSSRILNAVLVAWEFTIDDLLFTIGN